MAQLIKKQAAIGSATVYYTGGSSWTDNRDEAFVFANVDAANNHMVNPDGTNGGFTGATLETK